MFKRIRQLFRSDRPDFDHYTDAVERVKQLKREKRHDEAEKLLLWCIEQAEKETEYETLPPWYYKHLGIVYRKEERYDDEVKILQRYINRTANPKKELRERLQRAQELANSS
ncbi:hypothetical protein [Halococcus salsus]|uniref:hypothetical protein n=1 Tax=Halococcus salsus TaxID=2162894 RepID=UPI00135CB117|nr:hypothetical protein [Halococcus salsus]